MMSFQRWMSHRAKIDLTSPFQWPACRLNIQNKA